VAPRAIAGLLVLALSAAAWAEQDDGERDGKTPQEIPETVVEATPVPPPAEPAPLPPVIDSASLGPPSLLQGSLFSSALADGYLSDSTTTGTWLDVPDLQLPLTVDAVTRPLLRDQQVITVRESLRNVPAAIAVGDDQFADRFFLRGLEVRTRDFRRNGFLDPSFNQREIANIERIEFLKGPASVVYGSASPAGTVNFITKKPIDAQFSDVDFQFGSFGLDRYTLDTNGYATEGGALLYRFNGAYENADSFRDFGFVERYLLAPTARWIIGDNTLLTWEGEFLGNRRRGDLGFPTVLGNPLTLPPQRFVGDPAHDQVEGTDYRTSLVLEHRFETDWTLSVGAFAGFYEFDFSATGAIAPTPAPNIFVRDREDLSNREDTASLVVNLGGELEFAGCVHQLLFGTEQAHFGSESSVSQAIMAEPGFDVTNPVYTNPPTLPPFFAAQVPVFRQARHGYYFQDLMELTPHWQLLAGVRFDELDFNAERVVFGFPFPEINQRYERATPRVGVVYQPIPDVLTTYFNYGRSFNVPSGQGLLFSSGPLLPELGESYELGIKTLLLENLMVHAAGFHVTRENAPFLDTGALPLPLFLQVGEERAQGAEVEAVGEITERLSLIANYAYVDTRLLDPSTPLIFGQRQRNVPLHQSGVWSRYNLVDNECQTLGVGLGLVYVGQRTANLAASVQLPSYTRWDAGLYYRRGPLSAEVYVANLFDIDYAASSTNELRIYPGAPFDLRAQVGWTF
jgi:iron complex outermembrane receptor protein